MVPNAFNITNSSKDVTIDKINKFDKFETFKTESESDSDDETIEINSDGINGYNSDNYIVKTKNTNNANNSKNAKNTKNKSKNKGNLIGEGTFGCIYDDLKNPDKVHKIFLHANQYHEELNIAIMINNAFKNYNLNFPKGLLLPDNVNTPNINHVVNRDFLTTSGYKVCKLLKDKNNKYNKESYKYLTYNNCGEAINTCLDEFNTVFDLLVSLDYIFAAIADLETVSIAHHDIKMPNVLYDKTTNNTTLIDYGITYKYSDLFLLNHTNNKNWPVSYFVWPPEFNTIWYIMTNKYVPSARVMSDKVKSVVDIDDNYVPAFKDITLLKKTSNEDHVYELNNFRKKLIKELNIGDSVTRQINTINNDDLSVYFANNFGGKSDPYGLAMLIYAFNRHNEFLAKDALETHLVIYLGLNSIDELSDTKLEFCRNIREMIRKMGCPNPYTRYSSTECNNVYSKLIRNNLYKFKYGNTLNLFDKNKDKQRIETFLGNGETIISIANAGAQKPSMFLIAIIIFSFITLLILLQIYNK